jgi:hypothetical protein
MTALSYIIITITAFVLGIIIRNIVEYYKNGRVNKGLFSWWLRKKG